MSSNDTNDEGVILQSNRGYSSAVEDTSDKSLNTTSDSQEDSKKEETTDEDLLLCTCCGFSVNQTESTRFIGDSCPECFEGYLEENNE